MDLLEKENISYKVCPGVSSFCGAASALNAEYTLPGISQSVVITRMAGRTPVPEKESIESFAAHQATMVIFLSTGMLEELSKRLIEGGYQPETPAAIVYKATWEDEKVCRCKVKDLAESMNGHFYIIRSLQQSSGRAKEKKVQEMCKIGKVYVIGLGPGAEKEMTYQASTALEKSEVIIGYTVYTGLIRERFPDKKYLSTPMRQEVIRCEMAMDEAMKGSTVAMVCSGDAGIYGMAGLLYEMGQGYPEVELEVVPGITAANGGAAVLGAPLMHDFAVISLSDLLTPWEKIEKRIRGAAMADFVICLYNPSSRKRADYLKKACEYILEYQSPDTVCGYVRNIGREGEDAHILTLSELKDTEVDMFTTVYIGNSQTRNVDGKMVTPRGYRLEE